MKLSAMETTAALDLIVDIAPSMKNILDHPSCASLKGGEFNKGLIMQMLRDKKEDVAFVLSKLVGKTTDEILHQPLEITISEISENVDGDLLGFF